MNNRFRRVLQVNNHHRIIGGSDSVYFNTSELLRAQGSEVINFAAASEHDVPSPYSGYFPQGLDTKKLSLTDIGKYMRNADAAKAIDRLIRTVGPFDVAHLHIYYGRLTAAILPKLRRHGIPIVQTIHEYKLVCPVYTMERNGAVCEKCVQGNRLNAIRNRCKEGSLAKSIAVLAEFWASRLQGDVRFMDRIICVSDFQRGLMLRAGIPASKLVTLHNFVDPTLFKPVASEKKGDYFLYFGRIEALKGLPTLIRAAEKTGIALKVAGVGGWSQNMMRRIGGNSRVEALGYVGGQTLRDLISHAKAVVVPSEWYENCPMTVLEAKAAGTPVIGARIGGIPELIRDGVDGTLFEPGNVDDLSRAINDVCNGDLIGMAHAACEDVNARFSKEFHLERLIEIYESASER